MTDQSLALLESFEALSPDQQHEVAAEILRRSLSLQYPPLTDDDLARVADEQFQELDRHEARDA